MTATNQQDSQAGDEQITYGVDMGAPDGDKTALSIKRGGTVYSFVGDEAEVILAYAERLAVKREAQMKLQGQKDILKYLIANYPEETWLITILNSVNAKLTATLTKEAKL